MEERDVHHHAGAQHPPVPGLLDTVEGIRVGNQPVRCQGNLGKTVGADHLCLGVIDAGGQLQAAGFRPVGIDVIQGFVPGAFRERDHIQVFVGQFDVAVQRQADALAQQHLRQGKAVRGLGPEHIGLIGLDLDLESVGFSHDAGLHGSVHVGFKRVEKVRIGFREAFLSGDGDNLPVGLLHVQDDLRLLQVILGLRQVLPPGGHLVGIQDLSPHEHGLLHRHGPHPDVVQVGMERLVDVRADSVHRFGNIRKLKLYKGRRVHLLKHAENRLPHGAGHVFLRQRRIGLDGRHELGHRTGHGLRHGPGELFLHGSGRTLHDALHDRACALEHRRLEFIDKGDVPVVIQVGACGADGGEIVRQGDFPVIAGHFDPGACLLEILVGLEGHFTAVIQREALRLGGQGKDRQEQGKYESFFFHLYTF